MDDDIAGQELIESFDDEVGYQVQQLPKLKNDMQTAFVHNACSGISPAKAAGLAGYRDASQSAYQLTRKPHVLRAIRQRQVIKISVEVTLSCYDRFISIACANIISIMLGSR